MTKTKNIGKSLIICIQLIQKDMNIIKLDEGQHFFIIMLIINIFFKMDDYGLQD